MFNLITDLTALRRQALRLLLPVLWLQCALIAAACAVQHISPLAPLGAVVVLAIVVQTMAHVMGPSALTRMVFGVVLVSSVSVLVGVFAGQALQVDLHMSYFAGLALLVGFCDWRVIAVAAATVALHHLTLNFVLPALIYPGGSNVLRLGLHAVILVTEACVLAWLAFTVERMFSAVASAAARSEEARMEASVNHEKALAAAASAETAHKQRREIQARVAEEDHQTLERLALALERLAAGDLTYRILDPLPEKAEALRTDFNAAMSALQETMKVVSARASAISSGTDEISAAADDLARRTEQQAAGLEETAAALDQITAAVRHTADGANHARQVIACAKSDAESSGEVVRNTVAAMGGIEQSSREISEIIGVIDEIAFQTNLLALNAGVEAARAGDAGRGFAVVASEVRALAQRSAAAAKEIKALISKSAGEVNAGVALVDQTGDALTRIAAQITDINGVIADIAASAKEQAAGLHEVNAAINQMDQVTQQNAAMVQESTAASRALTKDVQLLAQGIGRFNVGVSPVGEVLSRPSAPITKFGTAGRSALARKPQPQPQAVSDADDWEAF